jgi:hypothetical protein
MGEKLYYLIDFLILTGIGCYVLVRPETLKKLTKNKLVIRLFGIVGLLYGCVELYRFITT